MFIVFEGIDGSGKTTVSNRVAGQLRALGLTVEHLREGGKFSSPVTQAIREFGRDARNLDLTPQAEFFLYVTRDVQLLDEATRPALARADVVIADRFLYSAEIIARFGRGLPEAWLRPVLDAAARGLSPDLVILVDVDPTLARARRKVAKLLAADRRPPSRKGLAGVGMQHRFRAGYLQLAAADPDRWVVVDNDQELDATVAQVFAVLGAAVREGVPAAVALARQQTPRSAAAPAPIASVEAALALFLAAIDRRALAEPNVAAYLLGGLFGPGVDERRLALAERAADPLVAGLEGLVDPVSWQIRDLLAARTPALVARSLGQPAHVHARAAPLRAALVAAAPTEVLGSLDGVDSDEAWQLRERLLASAPDVVVASLAGIDSERAWRMREGWLAALGGEAAIAVGPYENARALCRAVTGIDSERAWELRKAARPAAPIAAISSLKLLGSDRAWKWRARDLHRAPKAVLETIVGVDDPRAWQLREQTAPTVKEAIDSLYGLDADTAWRLREACVDLWPSTVIKSLGALSGTARGQALVARQLQRHPGNLSLLKHAAAIAVGANLQPMTPE